MLWRLGSAAPVDKRQGGCILLGNMDLHAQVAPQLAEELGGQRRRWQPLSKWSKRGSDWSRSASVKVNAYSKPSDQLSHAHDDSSGSLENGAMWTAPTKSARDFCQTLTATALGLAWDSNAKGKT